MNVFCWCIAYTDSSLPVFGFFTLLSAKTDADNTTGRLSAICSWTAIGNLFLDVSCLSCDTVIEKAALLPCFPRVPEDPTHCDGENDQRCEVDRKLARRIAFAISWCVSIVVTDFSIWHLKTLTSNASFALLQVHSMHLVVS